MPATILPTAYFPGLKLVTSDGTGAAAAASFANTKKYLCINLDDAPQLTDAEANPTTGDIRKIIFALETALYNATQLITAGDRPTKWTNSRQSSVNDTSNVIARTYVNQFSTAISGEEVAAEPV